MTTIQKNGSVFSVDLEKTREYYASPSPCTCANCRNYYSQVKDGFPVLDAFLNEFGADISSPDEILSVEMNDRVDYISVDYTVCGTIESVGEEEIILHDRAPIRIVFTNGFVSPNHQTGDYFSISVKQIQLPWILSEPFLGNKNDLKPPNGLLKRWFSKRRT